MDEAFRERDADVDGSVVDEADQEGGAAHWGDEGGAGDGTVPAPRPVGLGDVGRRGSALVPNPFLLPPSGGKVEPKWDYPPRI